MRVNIICKDDVNNWILGKFALKMQECLGQLGVQCTISKSVDEKADVNHNIIFYEYDGFNKGINTMMITHVDEFHKLKTIKEHLKTCSMGICMSNQMMCWLTKMGADRKKLCFVDPAHDGCALIKKYVIGIASRVYEDGRKREYFFDRFAEDLDPRFFEFKFMGAGWEKQVSSLRNKGFSVVYFDDFIRKKYYKFIQSLDYYLYTGTDEGQMGFVDAAAAGVPSIVTPQGYHLDAPDALTYPFWEYDDLLKILLDMQAERIKLIDSVKTWTWMDYAKKHLEIWKALNGESVQSGYNDGINSNIRLLNDDSIIIDNEYVAEEEKKLVENEIKHNNNKNNQQRPSFFFRIIRKTKSIIRSFSTR